VEIALRALDVSVVQVRLYLCLGGGEGLVDEGEIADRRPLLDAELGRVPRHVNRLVAIVFVRPLGPVMCNGDGDGLDVERDVSRGVV
jgi:hypothetical protein